MSTRRLFIKSCGSTLWGRIYPYIGVIHPVIRLVFNNEYSFILNLFFFNVGFTQRCKDSHFLGSGYLLFLIVLRYGTTEPYLFLWIFQIVSKEIVLWIITSIQRYSVWVSIALIGASRPWPRGYPWYALAGRFILFGVFRVTFYDREHPVDKFSTKHVHDTHNMLSFL